ncbi:hypothetical protein ACFL43_01670 [Thermodesulfobacteriota bacterium]
MTNHNLTRTESKNHKTCAIEKSKTNQTWVKTLLKVDRTAQKTALFLTEFHTKKTEFKMPLSANGKRFKEGEPVKIPGINNGLGDVRGEVRKRLILPPRLTIQYMTPHLCVGSHLIPHLNINARKICQSLIFPK